MVVATSQPPVLARASFVHLRVHTAYSMLEGMLRASELVDYCQRYRVPALGITDSHGLFGIPEMSLALEKGGIKPLLGLEAQLCFETAGQRLRLAPLVFFAMNDKGYANLMRLASALYRIEPQEENANEENVNTDEQAHARQHAPQQEVARTAIADKPYLNMQQLQRYNEGILTLSGGLDGPLGILLAEQRTREARALAQDLHEIFPQRFYIELNRFAPAEGGQANSSVAKHALARERLIEKGLLALCTEIDLPPVASNNCMFADQSMYEAHDVLLAIADGVHVSHEHRRRAWRAQELASPDKMRALFADIPEACENTLCIAERCSKIFEPCAPMLPHFATQEGTSEAELLQSQASQGLARIFRERLKLADGDERRKVYEERLVLELGVIIEKGLQGYFLIVADFIHWAKTQGIPVGPGRGSGAGSLVAWALDITALNPVRWDLLFERFLNPERMSMPDFDIDFCQERREQVIAYVRQRYGDAKVGQILTLGTLQARAAVRDVGRALGIAYPRVDRLCKTIPPLRSLEDSLSESDSPLARARTEPELGKLLDLSVKLEGLYRHASTHAAGIVIGDRALLELVPLYRDKDSDSCSTQFTMKYVEQAGLIKFDFLGLKTLSVMAHCQKLLKVKGIDLDMEGLDLDCPRVYDLFSRAETFGVFQFESSGIRDVLRRMRPDRFEDIVAAVALYRPGPMEQIPSYIARKHGQQTISYLHEKLESLLAETYGIPVYQEQVIRMAQVLAGFTLGASDHLRHAMGKKDPVEMAAQRKNFLDGCVNNGIESRLATKIFEQIYAFAGYGFNKSHAAAYAMIAYQTAWLRVHHAVVFFTSMMVFDAENTDRLAQYVPCLHDLEIPILPPDVNFSRAEFSLEDRDGSESIRYGLGALKHVGFAAMQGLVAEREMNGAFGDLFDFAERLAGHSLSRRALESLARSGALDGLNKNRAQSFEAIDLLLYVMQCKSAEEESQDSLFGKDEQSALAPRTLPETVAWEREQEMREEREAVGFYLSGHPLADSIKLCREQDFLTSSALEGMKGGERFRILGRVEGIREKRLKDSTRRLMLLSFSDPEGLFEATMFDRQAQKYPFLQEDAAIVLELDCVRIEARDSIQLRVVEVTLFEKFVARLAEDKSNSKGNGKSVASKPTVSKPTDSDTVASSDVSASEQVKVERLQLYVGELARGWNPQGLAKLLAEHASAGSGKIELYIRDDKRVLRVSLAQNYRLDKPLERALKDLAGVDRVERLRAA